jgi:hypothetical protein
MITGKKVGVWSSSWSKPDLINIVLVFAEGLAQEETYKVWRSGLVVLLLGTLFEFGSCCSA